MKVAIIYNRDISKVINRFGIQNKEIYNPQTVRMVADSLESAGHNVRVINGDMHLIERLQEFMPSVMEGEKMGMVFNMAYGIQGEARYTHLPSMLEMLGIPYVGSNPEGHTLALDKVITKIIMQKYNIPTPHFQVYSSADEYPDDLGFPVIVKPKMEAVSFGLRIAENKNELQDAIDFIIEEYSQPALVEQFIPGREFCVGLLGNGNPEVFPILEIDLENDPFGIQTVENKKFKPRNKICPAILSEDLSKRMADLSKEAFRSLGLRDFARVDIRLDSDNNIYLLEINSMASLGTTGSYVQAAKVAGYDYKKLVNKMLDVATVRYFERNTAPVNRNESVLSEKKNNLPAKIRGFLRSRQDKTEKLLSDLVNINSFVRNIDGVNNLGNIISKQLSQLGFLLQVIPQVEVGNILFFSNTPERSLDILIVCHLDSPISFTKHNSFRETSDRLYGTGIWENKGGICVLLAALQSLRFLRALRNIKTGILFTTDNALQGKFSQVYIRDFSQRSGYVIGLSGSSMGSTVITSRSGAAVYTAQMNLMNPKGSSDVASSSARFLKLVSSITEMTDEKNGIVITPRSVELRSDIAEIFAEGEVSFSIRFNDRKKAEKIDDRIRLLVKKSNASSCRFRVEGGIRRLPVIKTDETEHLFRSIKRISNDLDIRILEEHRWSSSDISSADESKTIVDGLGPVGAFETEHREFILRHSLPERASLLALLILELKKGK